MLGLAYWLFINSCSVCLSFIQWFLCVNHLVRQFKYLLESLNMFILCPFCVPSFTSLMFLQIKFLIQVIINGRHFVNNLVFPGFSYEFFIINWVSFLSYRISAIFHPMNLFFFHLFKGLMLRSILISWLQFPIFLCFLSFTKLRQLLTMYSQCFMSKFLSIFSYSHLP